VADEITRDEIEQTKERIRVVGICGSLRSGSFTRAALQIALDGAAELGTETQLIDLRDYELVFCHGEENKRACGGKCRRRRGSSKPPRSITAG